MRKWTKTPANGQEFAVLLLPRFSNHCLANAVEPLRAANDLLGHAFYKWSFVTLDGKGVASSSGLPVLPDGPLRDHPGADTLFVLASFDAAKLSTPECRRSLRAAETRFKNLAGMDTGSWLLADAGLLDHRTATIHPNEQVAFAERFEAVDVVPDRYVISDRVLTCGGAMTSFDLVLEMIRGTHGEALKLEISSYFLEHAPVALPDRYLSQSQDPILRACLDQMGRHIETPLTVPHLAAIVNTSQRTLMRVFQRELGASPSVVYRRLRLIAARQMARQSRYSIYEIALRCGYQNAAAMTRAFVNEFGCPPSAIRNQSETIEA